MRLRARTFWESSGDGFNSQSVVLLGLTLLLPLRAAAVPASIVRGDARIQILSSGLVRLEYSPTHKFTDLLSVATETRDLDGAEYHASDGNGWLEVSTEKLTVRYKTGSGPFNSANTSITWRDEFGDHIWKPGDKDDRNLGGVPGDIARRALPGNEPGPLSRNGYFLLDDSHTAVWNRAHTWVQPRENRAGQDWYFFVYGRDFKNLLQSLSRLTGPPPMIPRYALGTWFGSRIGYSADQWERIIRRFKEEHIPLDVLVLDSDSTTKYIWGGYDWDREQMPDPTAFFKYAREAGVKVTVNEHYAPLTRVNSDNFERMRLALDLPPETKEIPHDLASKKYAELFMDVLHKPALDAGMSFWWQDGNASANMDGLDATFWTRYVEYTGSERITGKRAFVFSRLGTPPWKEYPKVPTSPAWGAQRYGAFFTGDLQPHWSTLDLLVPFNVQAGNMLVPFVNNLTAGVYEDSLDPELYERWVQFSSLSPIFWWHGMWGLRMPWEYGPDGLSTARRFLRLRYSLLPYMYTYSRIAHDTGQPLVRGTYLEYPHDEASYHFQKQYLLGKELLVAPITVSGYGKPVVKEIHLPAGEYWYDFFSGTIYEGGRTIAYDCPLDRMPLFVKAGSILPLAPEMDSTDQKPVDPLTIEVFAGKRASFRLYEDDGVSLGYRNKESSWTPLTYEPMGEKGRHLITIGPSEGHYKGQPSSRTYKIRVHGLLKPSTVKLEARALAEKGAGDSSTGWYWDPATSLLSIYLGDARPLAERITVDIQNAGSFEDAHLVQRVSTMRAQIRQVELDEKMKWGLLLRNQDIKKEPLVLREIEQVEQQLDDSLVAPQSLIQNPPDFRLMTERILTSFVNRPFDSTRTIPEIDPDAQEATRSIEGATFSSDELHKMTADLLGCRLHASAAGDQSPVIRARLDCDSSNISPYQVSYSIALPDEGLPGWGEIGRTLDGDGFINFELKAPYPAPPGPHQIRLRSLLKWDGGETEVIGDVQWFSGAR